MCVWGKLILFWEVVKFEFYAWAEERNAMKLFFQLYVLILGLWPDCCFLSVLCGLTKFVIEMCIFACVVFSSLKSFIVEMSVYFNMMDCVFPSI